MKPIIALSLLLAGCVAVPAAPTASVAPATAPVATGTPVAPPEAAQGLVVAPGETVRVLTVEQWRALLAFPAEARWEMARIATCESGFRTDVVGALGEVGPWQIHPIHGVVPSDLAGNAAVAAALLAARPDAGDWIATRGGCAAWTR